MERLGLFGFDDYRVLHTILQDPADDIISRASRRIGRFIQLDGKRMLNPDRKRVIPVVSLEILRLGLNLVFM